jgi:hypothetical protein
MSIPMNGKSIYSYLAILLFLVVVVSCKKTENDILYAPSLNCSTIALTTSAFTNSGSAQSTTLSVGLSNAVAGSITFAIVSADFTPNTYTTTVKDGQTSVAIPLTFDGTTSLTSETITVSASSYGTGTCATTATVSAGSSMTTSPDCSTATTQAARVVCAAEAFMATLTTAQKAALVLDYNKANAIKWSNLPCGSGCRNGLQFSTLTTAQVTAALAVVAAATSTTANEGYSEITQIRAADDILNLTSNSSSYSSGLYFIAFLGTPSTTGTWQLQYGGHHLAINTTYNGGTVKSATPLFEGVEPKSWTAAIGGTVYAPLADEQSAMAAMLASLSTDQLSSAKLSATFSDVVLGPDNDGKFPATKVGIKVSSLTTDQQALVLAAMKPWLQDTDDATATDLLATYKSELDNTYIAYSGNATLTANADYVRIDGPSVWIEFVCQTGVVYPTQIHYHSVWRDHTRDYGGSFAF